MQDPRAPVELAYRGGTGERSVRGRDGLGRSGCSLFLNVQNATADLHQEKQVQNPVQASTARRVCVWVTSVGGVRVGLNK